MAPRNRIEPGDHRVPGIEAPRVPADKCHGDRRGDRARKDHFARLPRREAVQLLQKDRQHEERAVEREPQRAGEQHPGRELAALEHPEINDRLLDRQLAPDEQNRGDRRDDGERRDELRVEPVEAFAALQHPLQGADRQGQQRDAAQVDGLGPHLEFGIADVPEDQKRRQDPEWHIDVEDPRPAVAVDDVAAERGADSRADHDAHSEHGLSDAHFRRRKGLEQRRLRGGQECAAAQALHHAPQDQRVERPCGAAEKRRAHEQNDRSGEVALPPEVPGQPARHRDDNHVGDDVSGRHPRDLVERGAEISHHVRDRDVDDRRVDQFEHRGERDRDGDDVFVGVGVRGHRRRAGGGGAALDLSKRDSGHGQAEMGGGGSGGSRHSPSLPMGVRSTSSFRCACPRTCRDGARSSGRAYPSAGCAPGCAARPS